MLDSNLMLTAHVGSELRAERSSRDRPGLVTGISRFVFKDWSGPKLRVWTYIPRSLKDDAPVLFVMHGVERNAKRYLRGWAGEAERYGAVIVAPEFDERRFPGADAYNQGGVTGALAGAISAPDTWAFSVIDPVFEEVKRRAQLSTPRYSIYGHSAGAQFVHRFVLMSETKLLEQAIAANAGWYTLLDPEVAYPRGLKLNRQFEPNLSRSFDRRLTVLLGTEDVASDDKNLRDDAWARGQGSNRFARGRAFFSHAQLVAAAHLLTLNWRLRYAPGIGHENRRMSSIAAEILFGPAPAVRTPAVVISISQGETSENGAVLELAAPDALRLEHVGCLFVEGNRIDAWGSHPGELSPSREAVTLHHPIRSDAMLKIVILDGADKDGRSSAQLRRKVDAAIKDGANLVLLLNSPSHGSIRPTQNATVIHLPKAEGSKAPRDRQAAQQNAGLLVSVSPDPVTERLRVCLYPARRERAHNELLSNGLDRGRWKSFSKVVRRVIFQCKDRIEFVAGRDILGDFLAFDVSLPPDS